MPLRREFNEMHSNAKWYRQCPERKEAGQNKKSPAATPPDVVAAAGDFADEEESGKSDIHAEKHGENVSEALIRVRPEPVRRRSAGKPVRRGKFHGHPDSGNGEVILPSADGLALGRGGQRERNEDYAGDGSGAWECERICSNGINQICKERGSAKQVAGAGAESGREEFGNPASREQKHHPEVE